MCLAQGPQRSDAGEARTCGPSVSSQATALPTEAYERADNICCEWVEKGLEQVHTVLSAKSDSDVMFCLQSNQGLGIYRSIVY